MLEFRIKKGIREYNSYEGRKKIKKYRLCEQEGPIMLPDLLIEIVDEDGEKSRLNTNIDYEEIAKTPGYMEKYKELLGRGFIDC